MTLWVFARFPNSYRELSAARTLLWSPHGWVHGVFLPSPKLLLCLEGSEFMPSETLHRRDAVSELSHKSRGGFTASFFHFS
jgi:hypothetical protein